MTGSFREGNMLGGRAQKIVLVDDNSDLTLTAKLYLAMQGYDVWVADTGTKGVALIKEVRPEVCNQCCKMPSSKRNKFNFLFINIY